MRIQNNRTTRTLIATISCLIVVIAAFYWADEMMAMRKEATDVAELREQQARLVQTATTLNESVATIHSELSAFDQSAVTIDELSKFRQELVDIVRQQNCQLRQLRVDPTPSRHWHGEDDSPSADQFEEEASVTSLMLNTSIVEIKATGSLISIRGLIRTIHQHGWLSHTDRFELRPIDQKGQLIELNYKFSVFGLTEQTVAEAATDEMT